MFVDKAVLSLLGVGNDAARHGSGNLSAEYLLAVRSGEQDVGMLVFLTGLRQPCFMIVAVKMSDELHLAVDREPVGMDIYNAHEDGNHQTAVMEIFILVNLLNDNNLSVGWCHDNILGILRREMADRTTIEIHNKGISHSKDKEKYDEWDFSAKSEPKKKGN